MGRCAVHLLAREPNAVLEVELCKVLDTLTDAAIVMEVDTGLIVLWNRAAEEIFGYSAQEVIGKPADRLMPADMRARHNAGLAAYRETGHGALIDSGKPLELLALRRSGEPFAIELTLSRLDESKQPRRYVLALIRDVSERHRAEVRIRKSETRLAEAQQLAHVGWWEWDLLVDRVEWSDELYRIFGLDRATFAVSYEAFRSRVHPEDRPIVRQNIEAILRDHRPFVYQARVVRPDGAIRTILARGQLETDAHDRRPVRMLGTVQDVTDQIAIESALRRSNTLLQAQQEAALDGIVVVDERREVVGYNQRFLELWGLDEAVMERRRVQPVLDAIRPQIADWAAYLELVHYLLQHPLESSRDEIRLRDGRVFERYSSPAHSPQGEYFGRVWYFRDMTERKQVEEQLQESERRFRAIFDGAGVGIDLVTLEGRFIETNRALQELLGYSGEELRCMRFADLTHPDDAEISRQRFRELISGQRDYYKLEKRYLRKDGRVVWANLTVYLMRNRENQPSKVLAIIEDISERKRLDETLQRQYDQLKELDRLKSDFVNAVSHDLRSPLTAISGFAELLEDELAGPLTREQRGFIQQIEKNGQRLERMLNDLLDFARFEAGTFRLNCETVDFVPKLHDVVDSLKLQVEAARLHLELSQPEAPLLVTLDPERLERVLFNLLSNAIKFTPEGGSVRLTAESRDGMLYCAVTDTGAGIAPEDLPKLFRRFSQLEQGKRKKGGTGLGLSISKAIVEAHGGQIGVSSEPGKGSTFWFQVPLGGD